MKMLSRTLKTAVLVMGIWKTIWADPDDRKFLFIGSHYVYNPEISSIGEWKGKWCLDILRERESLGSGFIKRFQAQWTNAYYSNSLSSEIITEWENDLRQLPLENDSENSPLIWLERCGRAKVMPNSRWVIQVLAGSHGDDPKVILQLQPLRSSMSDEGYIAVKLYGADWLCPWDDEPGLHQLSMPGGYVLRKKSSSQDMCTIALKSDRFAIEIQGQGVGENADQYGSLVLFYYLVTSKAFENSSCPGTLVNFIHQSIVAFSNNPPSQRPSPSSPDPRQSTGEQVRTAATSAQGNGATPPDLISSLDPINNAIREYQRILSSEQVLGQILPMLNGIESAIASWKQAHSQLLGSSQPNSGNSPSPSGQSSQSSSNRNSPSPGSLNAQQPDRRNPPPSSGQDSQPSGSQASSRPVLRLRAPQQSLSAAYDQTTAYGRQKQGLIAQLATYQTALDDYLRRHNIPDVLNSSNLPVPGNLPAADDLFKNFDLFMGTINRLTGRSFVIQNVAGDGNCGFWAAMAIMQHFIMRDPGGCRRYRQSHSSNLATTGQSGGLWENAITNWQDFDPMAGTGSNMLVVKKGNQYEIDNSVTSRHWHIRAMVKLRAELASERNCDQYHIPDIKGKLPWLEAGHVKNKLPDVLQLPVLLITEEKGNNASQTISVTIGLFTSRPNEDFLLYDLWDWRNRQNDFLDMVRVLKQRPYIAIMYFEYYPLTPGYNHYKAILDLSLEAQP